MQHNFEFNDILPEGVSLENADVKIECSKEDAATGSEVVKYDKKTRKVQIKIPALASESTVTITLNVKASLNSKEEDGKEIINTATIRTDELSEVQELNKITNYVEYDAKQHVNNNTGDGKEEIPTSETYKISGVAWIDENKDGKRDENETLLSGVQVTLLYKHYNIFTF